ncbi:MAG: metabolite traffic protein EboE [Rhizobiaceae bacterium]|nr:metabolite traffic protein EboE [Rhizobiaceae bacterium]
MHLNDSLGHLTYCTNIHAGETWVEIFDGIRKNLPAVKAELSPNAPLGLGLRLSAIAGEALRDPAVFAEFEAFLKEGDYYIFTLNGFPYGTFHGQPVKEGAYRPDWSDPARLNYTNTLADHLAKWLPEGMEGSISTVPGTYKAWVTGSDGVDIISTIGDNIVRHVAHLVAIQNRTGKTINLALEPEPSCLIETIEETIGFYTSHLFSDRAILLLEELTGLAADEASDALHRHIGVCYDVCHAAVEFEDAKSSLDALKEAGIKISKLQLSSALRIGEVNSDTATQLGAMNEPIYMHQVIQNQNGEITRFTDIPFALDTIDAAQGAEWRIHFHVPIFLEEMQDLGTTQQFLKDVLAIHKASPVTEQLEVETYTWDVLPDEYRRSGLSTMIARELAWVRDQLTP